MKKSKEQSVTKRNIINWNIHKCDLTFETKEVVLESLTKLENSCTDCDVSDPLHKSARIHPIVRKSLRYRILCIKVNLSPSTPKHKRSSSEDNDWCDMYCRKVCNSLMLRN